MNKDNRRLSCSSVKTIVEEISNDIIKYKTLLENHLQVPESPFSDCHHRQELSDKATDLIKTIEVVKSNINCHINIEVEIRDKSGRTTQIDSGVYSRIISPTQSVIVANSASGYSSAVEEQFKHPVKETGEQTKDEKQGLTD